MYLFYLSNGSRVLLIILIRCWGLCLHNRWLNNTRWYSEKTANQSIQKASLKTPLYMHGFVRQSTSYYVERLGHMSYKILCWSDKLDWRNWYMYKGTLTFNRNYGQNGGNIQWCKKDTRVIVLLTTLLI